MGLEINNNLVSEMSSEEIIENLVDVGYIALAIAVIVGVARYGFRKMTGADKK